MNKRLLITGSVLGLFGVLIGAFGAHGLEKTLGTQELATFETGVRYQIYHAILLLIIPTFSLSLKTKKALWILLLLGVLFFSGSIYGLATNEMSPFDFKKIAIITPVGGTLLISAWVLLVYNFIKSSSNK